MSRKDGKRNGEIRPAEEEKKTFSCGFVDLVVAVDGKITSMYLCIHVCV